MSMTDDEWRMTGDDGVAGYDDGYDDADDADGDDDG
jgi:hypothetical protein